MAGSSSLSIPDLSAADDAVLALSRDWLGSIPFSICVISDDLDPAVQDLPPSKFATENICKYFGGNMYPAQRLYFCPKSYPPPSSIEDMDSSNDVHQPQWFMFLFGRLCRAGLYPDRRLCRLSAGGGPVGLTVAVVLSAGAVECGLSMSMASSDSEVVFSDSIGRVRLVRRSILFAVD